VTKDDFANISSLLDKLQVRVTEIQTKKSPWERLKASREFQDEATAAVEKAQESGAEGVKATR
jgi:hypothetical protein